MKGITKHFEFSEVSALSGKELVTKLCHFDLDGRFPRPNSGQIKRFYRRVIMVENPMSLLVMMQPPPLLNKARAAGVDSRDPDQGPPVLHGAEGGKVMVNPKGHGIDPFGAIFDALPNDALRSDQRDSAGDDPSDPLLDPVETIAESEVLGSEVMDPKAATGEAVEADIPDPLSAPWVSETASRLDTPQRARVFKAEELDVSKPPSSPATESDAAQSGARTHDAKLGFEADTIDHHWQGWAAIAADANTIQRTTQSAPTVAQTTIPLPPIGVAAATTSITGPRPAEIIPDIANPSGPRMDQTAPLVSNTPPPSSLGLPVKFAAQMPSPKAEAAHISPTIHPTASGDPMPVLDSATEPPLFHATAASSMESDFAPRATPVADRAFAQHIPTQILDRLLTQSGMPNASPGNSPQRMELILHPQELGRLHLITQASDGAVTLMIHAERPETADLMRRHLELLTDELRKGGFDLSNGTFADPNGGERRTVKQRGPEMDQTGQTKASQVDPPPGAVETLPTATPLPNGPQLDIRV